MTLSDLCQGVAQSGHEEKLVKRELHKDMMSEMLEAERRKQLRRMILSLYQLRAEGLTSHAHCPSRNGLNICGEDR